MPIDTPIQFVGPLARDKHSDKREIIIHNLPPICQEREGPKIVVGAKPPSTSSHDESSENHTTPGLVLYVAHIADWNEYLVSDNCKQLAELLGSYLQEGFSFSSVS